MAVLTVTIDLQEMAHGTGYSDTWAARYLRGKCRAYHQPGSKVVYLVYRHSSLWMWQGQTIWFSPTPLSHMLTAAKWKHCQANQPASQPTLDSDTLQERWSIEFVSCLLPSSTFKPGRRRTRVLSAIDRKVKCNSIFSFFLR